MHALLECFQACCATKFDGLLRNLLEVERVRADQHWGAHRAGFNQILSAERQPAAADQRHICSCVVGKHLAHRVTQPDPGIAVHWGVVAAPLQRQPARLHERADLIEALRVAGYDHQQDLGRRETGKGIQQQGLLTVARARGKQDRPCAATGAKDVRQRGDLVGRGHVELDVAGNADTARAER